MNIIGHRNIFYVFSAALLLASAAAIIMWGLKFGIDFTGGSLLEVEFTAMRPPLGELDRRIESLSLGEVRLVPTGERGLIVRSRHMSEAEHQAMLLALSGVEGLALSGPVVSHVEPVEGLALGSSDGGTAPDGDALREKRFDTIGPTIGRELARRSLIAIALVILLIVSYIAWAFRKVSEPTALGRTAGLASWKYGATTVIALVHDVLIPAGFFAAAGHFLGFEVDTLFVTAILTILGFSVHDTIVVFDRIRENLKKGARHGDFSTLVNDSVSQTLVRSINTSLTVALALVAVYLFGGATTKVFSLTLLIGIIVGTYSSIFIASPLLVTWQQWQTRVKSK